MQNELYNICEITDKQVWDNFVTSQANYTFLHSWVWGEFNEAMGDKIWRFGIYLNRAGSDPARLSAVAMAIKVHARRGNFLFIPHGPVGSSETLRPPSGGGGFLQTLREFAQQEKVSFIRVSPLLKDTQESRELFKQLGFRPAPIHMHAETTWTLDLAPSEDELLLGMRKTTRNLIRRAVKEGVEIKKGISDTDVGIFYNLYKETFKKHNFTPFSLTFLQKQVRILQDTHIFTAYHRDQPLASAIIVFYGNSAFYHHGASITSKIPAAHLLQWEVIREAKRRRHKFYNFWGILKEDAPANHPWQGITLFKKGFGGFETNYMRAQDLSLSWRYWINWTIETLRRKKRRL